MRRFGYLKDPLCVVSLSVYAGNQWLLKPFLNGLPSGPLDGVRAFAQFHLNDSLLIPAALPVALWIQRLTGLRRTDAPPAWAEMFLHLAVWSVMCKFVGPYRLHIGAPDPWDLLFYAAGGVFACVWWDTRLPKGAERFSTSLKQNLAATSPKG